MKKNDKEGKISSLLTLEDGGVCFNDLAMLRNYYRMGVRMIALTWNYENRNWLSKPFYERYEWEST
ncbi:MAG: membrane dipeptidase [Holdemanella porci]